ncbi:MAG: nickel pincer cofactor biosynthesis protein LarC [Desulfuromonadales bacterium]
MNILYLDCYAGISGDMTVAALLDLGVPLEYLRSELGTLALPPDSYALSTSRTERQHVTALKFDVAVHDHHTHRHYAGIDTMIADSGLSGAVKGRARAIFRRLAEAEAKVHCVDVEEVHFHEVGAVDSIVDIVGTAICLEYLHVDQINVSALPLGSGFVETAHGRLPIPAPATVELLKGLPLHGACGQGERVTPTGAAIVAALAGGFGTQPAMLLEKSGCGAGRKDFTDCPNILRAFLGRSIEDPDHADEVTVVETNIDDSTPEVLGYTMERLLDAGALDVFFTSTLMKKNRPGVVLSFLCRPNQVDGLAKIVLTETSAIGLRHYRADRIILERRIVEQQTESGPVRFKQVFDGNGNLLRAAPEYDDCRRVARERGIPLQDVLRGVMERVGPVDPLDEELASLFRKQGMTLALAESCTGGMIAQRITAMPGSSAYFLEGAVTYSNSAKTRQLAVPKETLEEWGAVSSEVAAAMATGVRERAMSDLGLAVTGIAGPDGGSEEKPVGTVFIALATPDGCRTKRFQFNGGRDEVRTLTARTALEWLRRYLRRRIEAETLPTLAPPKTGGGI